MSITGKHFIGGMRTAAGHKKFSAKDATTREILEPPFHEATADEVDQCLQLADESFDALRTASTKQILALLEGIASGLMDVGDPLLERAHAESALPMTRLVAERERTVNHTRMFAEMVREGSWVQARIDQGDPDRKPMPKPDVRTRLHGVGPVVVFGASNFPLAISVAGTDTVSALAARCPVVVKAHPGHPGTCEMIAEVIVGAVENAGLPAGVFGMVQGASNAVGQELVKHPLASAIAFTGSLQGGRALYDVAVARPNPIPFYAEMGSINPVFLLPSAIDSDAEAEARAYIQSVTMGTGQFCTNPGLVLAEKGAGLEKFLQATSSIAEGAACASMLHDGIHSTFQSGVNRLKEMPGVEQVGQSADAEKHANQAACTILTAEVGLIDEQPQLSEEIFGPVSVVLRCESKEDMLRFARQLEGQLTATVHGSEKELLEHAELIRILERKVGRIVFNGYPTGIEVCGAMHHGGPYPATTHSGYTSIGPASIYRFAKPVCYQGFPNAALPVELQSNVCE